MPKGKNKIIKESIMKKERISISIEEILEMQRQRRYVNSIDLNSVRIYYKGELIKVSKKYIKDFAFTGLNNIDFYTMLYEDKLKEK